MAKRRILRREWIDDLASDLAIVHGFRQPPVDPTLMAESEGIRLFGDDFGDAFDGRTEIVDHRFVIYYNNRYGKNHPRTRFSVAHELGHFYIDDHRSFLLKNKRIHSSRTGFVSDNKAEREADLFAASLLLPRDLLLGVMNRGLPDLREVLRLAQLFQTSLMATAIRYVELSHFVCVAIVSSDGRVEFAARSEAARDTGFTFLRRGTTVPAASPTSPLTADKKRVLRAERVEGRVAAYEWFDNASGQRDLYEQAMGLGRTGKVLTLLSAEEDENE